MKALADYVATLAATYGRPRPNDQWGIIVCSYYDKRGHAEVECFNRQRHKKRKVDALAPPETFVVAATDVAPLPKPGVPWAILACVSISPSLELKPDALKDVSFISYDTFFFDNMGAPTRPCFNQVVGWPFSSAQSPVADDICGDTSHLTVTSYRDDLVTFLHIPFSCHDVLLGHLDHVDRSSLSLHTLIPMTAPPTSIL
jgi:hypothetical protein